MLLICWLRVTGPCEGSRAPQRTWFVAGTNSGPGCQQRRHAWQRTCGHRAYIELFVAASQQSPSQQAELLRPANGVLPLCARHILSGCQLRHIPRRFSTVLTPLLSRAYLIHHTRNVQRLKFQLRQLPRLGLPLTIVAGFDANDLSDAVRRCVLDNRSAPDAMFRRYLWRRYAPSKAAAATPEQTLEDQPRGYFSQSIKLYAAMLDMHLHPYQRLPTLLLEDDAVLRYRLVRLHQLLCFASAGFRLFIPNRSANHPQSTPRAGSSSLKLVAAAKDSPRILLSSYSILSISLPLRTGMMPSTSSRSPSLSSAAVTSRCASSAHTPPTAATR